MNRHTILIEVVPRTRGGECKPAAVLKRILHQGGLSGFLNAFNDYTSEAGNCHDVAVALMVDLIAAGYSEGWTWVQARVSFGTLGDPAEHSWLEFDGWAVDAASGRCLVIDAGWYREKCHAGDYLVRDAEATRAWLIQNMVG